LAGRASGEMTPRQMVLRKAGPRDPGTIAKKLHSVASQTRDLRPAWPAVTRRAVAGYKKSFDVSGPGWRQLAPNTKRDRVRKGYEPSGPILVASGRMRDHVLDPDVVEGLEFLEIVVSDEVLFYHQTGTRRMPQRPIHLRRRDGTWMSDEVRHLVIGAYIRGAVLVG
jgi:hypothetical protein